MPMWWRRLVCHFAGHKWAEDRYVPGSWRLPCDRCDFEARL